MYENQIASLNKSRKPLYCNQFSFMNALAFSADSNRNIISHIKDHGCIHLSDELFRYKLVIVGGYAQAIRHQSNRDAPEFSFYVPHTLREFLFIRKTLHSCYEGDNLTWIKYPYICPDLEIAEVAIEVLIKWFKRFRRGYDSLFTNIARQHINLIQEILTNEQYRDICH